MKKKQKIIERITIEKDQYFGIEVVVYEILS